MRMLAILLLLPALAGGQITRYAGKGLHARYSFEDGKGRDLSGNGNHLTETATPGAFIPGAFGKAYNATNSAGVMLVNSNAIATIGAVTAWVYFATPWTYTTSADCVVCMTDDSDPFGIYLGNVTGAYTNEVITIISSVSGSARRTAVLGNLIPVIGVGWHHFAISIQTNSTSSGVGRYSIYFDGVEYPSVQFNAGVAVQAGNRISIGKMPYYPTAQTLGKPIDEVCVYTNALSNQDIHAIYYSRKDTP